MSLTIDKIAAESLSLPAEDRTILAHRIWESVADFSDTEVEQAWLTETDRRWKQIEKGEVECVPHGEIIQRLRKKLNCKR